MVSEGIFPGLGIVLADKGRGGFNRKFRACPAVGRASGPIGDEDSQEGRLVRIGFDLGEATILARRAGGGVGSAYRRGGHDSPRHTEAQPCGGCNGTSVPGVD